jgi:hypothetical protein
MKKTIVNLTPHELTLDGEKIKSSGMLRVETSQKKIGSINGVDIMEKTFGKVEDLPEKKEDTVYVVSSITASAIKEQYPERGDFLIVNETIRDDDGHIIGCKNLACV